MLRLLCYFYPQHYKRRTIAVFLFHILTASLLVLFSGIGILIGFVSFFISNNIWWILTILILVRLAI